MLPGVRRSDLCYYIGAAYDLINPLLNTDCRRLICVDLIDRWYYPVTKLGLDLSPKVERDIHMYSVLSRFVKQWTQLSEGNRRFGRISRIGLKGNRFEIVLRYKNRERLIVFYSGVDGNDAPEPKEVRGKELGVLYISMGTVEASTIQRLKPRQIVVYHTVLNDYLKRRKHTAVIGERIDPFIDQVMVRMNSEYLVWDRGAGRVDRGCQRMGAREQLETRTRCSAARYSKIRARGNRGRREI